MKLYLQVAAIFLAGLLLSSASAGTVAPSRERPTSEAPFKDYGPVVTPIILTMEPRVRTLVVPPLPSNEIEKEPLTANDIEKVEDRDEITTES